MIASTILTLCVLSTTGGHECDVRVQYLQEVHSMQECRKDMKQLATRMMAEVVKNEPSLIPQVMKGDCVSTNETAAILNAIPEYFRGVGYSYQVTFY